MDIMNETLPISIQVSDDLAAEIKNIAAIGNKLAAQLNFHTMTANWFSDEANIILINFYLISINELNGLTTQVNKLETLADDVFLSSKDNIFDCHLTITYAESQLIQQQPKLLSGYLAKKLTKVLNLIADSQKFAHI